MVDEHLAPGPDAATRERIAEAHEAADDWTAKCQVCGIVLRGTLAELRAHQHDREVAPHAAD